MKDNAAFRQMAAHRARLRNSIAPDWMSAFLYLGCPVLMRQFATICNVLGGKRVPSQVVGAAGACNDPAISKLLVDYADSYRGF